MVARVSHELHVQPRHLALVPAGGGAVLAALTRLADAHGEKAQLIETARIDAAFVASCASGMAPDLALGCLLRGDLGPSPLSDPTHAQVLLPVIDVESSVALRDLSDAKLELVARHLGWAPRVTDGSVASLHAALAWARHEIRVLQATAREGIVPSRVAWPVVLVRLSRGGGVA